MSYRLDSHYHIVDGKIVDIGKQLHPLENIFDKTVYIKRFCSLFGDDISHEDISGGKGKLFKIQYKGYDYNVYIEAFDGGGRDKSKKIAIPATNQKNGSAFKTLIQNYDSVLIINEYVPLKQTSEGRLELCDTSVYAIIKPEEVYASKVIREQTGNASSRWVDLDILLRAYNENCVLENSAKNVYVIPSNKLKSFFDTSLINEQYESMSKYLFEEYKKGESDKDKIVGSIGRIFRNKLIKNRLKSINGSCPVCACEFCNCTVDIPELLVASHINARANIRNDDSLTDEEKFNLMTDINNGFLLCRTHDAIFDKKFITIDEEGNLVVSSELLGKEKEFNIENLEGTEVIKGVSSEMQEYLKQHRLDYQKKIRSKKK